MRTTKHCWAFVVLLWLLLPSFALCEEVNLELALGAIVDSENPVIYADTITADKISATVGDTVIISVKITDNVGVTTANLGFTNLDSNKMMHFQSLRYNPETDLYEHTFNVTENTPNGTWVVHEVYATDEVGNYTFSHKQVEVFTVYGAADSERPHIDLSSITATPAYATVGDTVKISAIITDNVGVASANIALTNLESNKSYHFLSMVYNSETDRWERSFTVTEDTPNGTFAVSSFHAYDAVDNTDIQFPYTEVFQVYGAADSEKPTIYTESIQSSTQSATLYDEVTVSVRITDNEAIDFANIQLFNPDASNSLLFRTLTYNPNTDRWEYTLRITDTIPDGQWRLQEVYVSDTTGNINIVNPDTYLFTSDHYYDFSSTNTLTLPASLRAIGEEAFSGTNVTDVVLPIGCERIESKAFSGIDGVLRIFIPSSVGYIADDAFLNSNSVVIYSNGHDYVEEFASSQNIYFVYNIRP